MIFVDDGGDSGAQHTPAKKSKQEILEEMILKTIKMKEREMRERKKQRDNMRPLDSKRFKDMKDDLKKMAAVLKSYYRKRKVNNMFLVKVIDHVKRATLQFKDKDEIRKIIDTVVLKLGGWLKYVDNPAGKILRMNKAINPFKAIESLNPEEPFAS